MVEERYGEKPERTVPYDAINVYWKPAFLPSMEQIEQAVVLVERRREMVYILRLKGRPSA